MARTYRGPLAELEIDDVTNTDNARDYAFPVDELMMIDHWVTFRAFETKQLDRRSDSQSNVLNAIRLPMPANLSTAYNIQYNDSDLGPFGQMIVDGFGNDPEAQRRLQNLGGGVVAGALFGAATGSGAASGASLGALGAAAVDVATGQGRSPVTPAAASAAIGGLGAVGQGALANLAGVAINPHKVLLFQGIGFREHQFAYQFTPKNFREAEMLNSIIKLFKLYGSPSFQAPSATIPLSKLGNLPGIGTLSDANIDFSAGKHFFKYPEYFRIDFHHKDFLFGIGPSVLESFVIDYQPANQATYSRTEGKPPTPTQINLTLMFKETEIVTKENILSENR